jgi:CRP-like cAMP-binding protein
VIYHIYKTFVDDRSVKIHYPFLSRLPQRLRYELCRVLKPLAAVRGDVIYTEGEYGDEMYLVANGQCVAYKWTGDVTDHKRKLDERNQSIYATGQIQVRARREQFGQTDR